MALNAAPLKTILVVDDDAEVRNVITQILSEAGRFILSAANGYEAVRALTEHHVDLLVTDVRMPGINGFELARQAKLLQPELQVIYLSGYVAEAERKAGRTFGLLLYKPIRRHDLLSEIKQALGLSAAHRDG
jgi:CheY-like chemotaxis protein